MALVALILAAVALALVVLVVAGLSALVVFARRQFGPMLRPPKIPS